MAIKVNESGVAKAKSLISDGKINHGTWSAPDKYEKDWCLAIDGDEPKYPFGKDGEVYSKAIGSAESYAETNGETEIKKAASELSDMIKAKEVKGKKSEKTFPKDLGARDLTRLTTRSARMAPQTYNKETHCMHADIATENPVNVWDWERFDIVPEVLRMDGCELPENKQIPLMQDHRSHSIDMLRGSIRNLSMGATGKLEGDLYFAGDDDSQTAEGKARDGHLTDISVGYDAKESTYIPEGQKGIIGGREYHGPLKVTTKWAPKEGSLVPIGADSGTKMRSAMIQVIKEQLIARGLPDDASEEDTKKFVQELFRASGGISVRTNQKGAAAMPEQVNEQDVLKKERERTQTIRSIAAQLSGKYPNLDTLRDDAIEKGWSEAEFRGAIVQTALDSKDNGPIFTPASQIGMSEKEVRQYSLRNIILSKIPESGFKADFERECSVDAAKRMGITPKGFLVPYEVQMRGFGLNKPFVGSDGKLHEFSGQRSALTQPNSAGGYLIQTTVLANEFIDILRNRIVTAGLGLKVMTGLVGDVSIPKRTATGTFYWVGEGKKVSGSASTYGALKLTPHEGAIREDYSQQLLMQSTPSVDILTVDDITKDFGLGIDKAIYHGLGNAAQPLGIEHVPLVGIPTPASPAIFADMIALETAVANANARCRDDVLRHESEHHRHAEDQDESC